MKNQIVDRTQEKIALAKEIGLNSYAQALEEGKREVEELTKLTFKPITNQEIDRMIEKRIFKPLYHDDSAGFCLVSATITTALSVIMGGVVFSIEGFSHAIPVLKFITIIGFSLSAIGFLISSFPKCERNSANLDSWTDKIPYGGLLAVKEAKEAGLSNFRIYFPKLESRRVYADPVIVGYKNGIKSMLMVFAWDDGKVYE